jgi:Protein of unknown function (DUF1353)
LQDFVTELRADPVAIERSPLLAPILTYLSDRRRWRLEEPYAYKDGSTTITVPDGFLFDLSSVPRAFWWLIAPFELSIVAPLLHDYLYGHGGVPPEGVHPPRAYTRREADVLFRNVMEREGVSAWRRVLGYAAVRAFGGAAWKDHARA